MSDMIDFEIEKSDVSLLKKVPAISASETFNVNLSEQTNSNINSSNDLNLNLANSSAFRRIGSFGKPSTINTTITSESENDELYLSRVKYIEKVESNNHLQTIDQPELVQAYINDSNGVNRSSYSVTYNENVNMQSFNVNSAPSPDDIMNIVSLLVKNQLNSPSFSLGQSPITAHANSPAGLSRLDVNLSVYNQNNNKQQQYHDMLNSDDDTDLRLSKRVYGQYFDHSIASERSSLDNMYNINENRKLETINNTIPDEIPDSFISKIFKQKSKSNHTRNENDIKTYSSQANNTDKTNDSKRVTSDSLYSPSYPYFPSSSAVPSSSNATSLLPQSRVYSQSSGNSIRQNKAISTVESLRPNQHVEDVNSSNYSRQNQSKASIDNYYNNDNSYINLGDVRNVTRPSRIDNRDDFEYPSSHNQSRISSYAIDSTKNHNLFIHNDNIDTINNNHNEEAFPLSINAKDFQPSTSNLNPSNMLSQPMNYSQSISDGAVAYNSANCLYSTSNRIENTKNSLAFPDMDYLDNHTSSNNNNGLNSEIIRKDFDELSHFSHSSSHASLNFTRENVTGGGNIHNYDGIDNDDIVGQDSSGFYINNDEFAATNRNSINNNNASNLQSSQLFLDRKYGNYYEEKTTSVPSTELRRSKTSITSDHREMSVSASHQPLRLSTGSLGQLSNANKGQSHIKSNVLNNVSSLLSSNDYIEYNDSKSRSFSISHSLINIPSYSDNSSGYSHGGGSSGVSHGTGTGTGILPSFVSNINRNESIESPRSKNAYKEFLRHFRFKEKESLEAAYKYAKDSLHSAYNKIIWKIKLEMADVAKRMNDIDLARQLFEEVCDLQPLASQCWLERSKLEDDCGQLEKSLQILTEGLQKNFNEALLTRAIKQLEKLHNVAAARNMLSVLKHQSIERVWRAVFEGALLEARVGQSHVARQFFKYLMDNVSWYGPIYYEAFCLEERLGRYAHALVIVKKGLEALPRYGPLWFALLRVAEREDTNKEGKLWILGHVPMLRSLRLHCEKAIQSISRELVWKVYFECAQAEERAAEIAAIGMSNASLSNMSVTSCKELLFRNARLSLVRSLLFCPLNLRWKIWLASSRLEVSAGHPERSRQLLYQALKESPSKSKALIYLECARVEEFVKNFELAKRIIVKASLESKTEWKLCLELILMEARRGRFLVAIKAVQSALQIHPGAGRLWVVYIQLCHRFEHMTVSVSTQNHKKGLVPNDCDQVKDRDEISYYNTSFQYDDKDTRSLQPSLQSTDPHTDSEVSEHDIPHVSPIYPQYTSSFSVAYDEENELHEHALENALQHKDDVLLNALLEVPKSGEVWCEGSRCCLNPMIPTSFDLSAAQRNLNFAVQFTPQYGDTFIEYIKFECLCQVLLPRILHLLDIPVVPFIREYLLCDIESDIARLVCSDDSDDSLLISQFNDNDDDSNMSNSNRELRKNYIQKLASHEFEFFNIIDSLNSIVKGSLERRCTNADPNYGANWFYCRTSPIESPKYVLERAQNIIIHEIINTQSLYNHAIFCYIMKRLSSTDTNTSGQILSNKSKHLIESLSVQRRYQHLYSHSHVDTLDETSNKIQNSFIEFDGNIVSYLNGTNNSSGSSKYSYDSNKSSSNSDSHSHRHHLQNAYTSNDNISYDHDIRSINNILRKAEKGLPQQHSNKSFHSNFSLDADNEKSLFTDNTNILELIEDVLEVFQFSLFYEHDDVVFEYCSSEFASNENNVAKPNIFTKLKCLVSQFKALPIVDLSGSTYVLSDFLTALITLNRNMFNRCLDDDERRKILFGSDSTIVF